MDKKVIGLIYGLTSVFLGQILVISYYMLMVKRKDANLKKELVNHFSAIEGLVLIGGYLSITYLWNLMPNSYYCWEGNIKWNHVLFQLIVQDFFQYIFHRFEHYFSIIYKYCHQQHHQYKFPKLLDAFKGSILDTLTMILIPLWITSRIVHTNVWSYMVFGTIYSSWLMLIHCELDNPWDPLFQKIGFGTALDHRNHHKYFKCNYGHLFMFWDYMFGTHLN